MTLLAVLQVSFEELCQSTSISEELLLELVEYRIVEPVSGDIKNEWLFSVAAVSVAKKAMRLQRDLAIDVADVALMLNLLAENEQLKAENSWLKQRLNRFEKTEGEG